MMENRRKWVDFHEFLDIFMASWEDNGRDLETPELCEDACDLAEGCAAFKWLLGSLPSSVPVGISSYTSIRTYIYDVYDV